MAKLLRYDMSVFGSAATTNQMAEFGSLAAGTPLRFDGSTITPAIVQQLSNYLSGWFGAVLGGNSPAIEDMNSLCYLFSYQLAYMIQTGVPEWKATTTYYIGSVVSDATTNVAYISLVNSNINQPLTDRTKWQVLNMPITAKGDIIGGNSAKVPQTLPISSTTGFVLMVDPTSPVGFSWQSYTNGASATSIITASTYTLQTTDDKLFFNGTGTLNLMAATLSGGKRYLLYNYGSANMTINAAGSDSIIGQTSQTLPPMSGIEIYSDLISFWATN